MSLFTIIYIKIINSSVFLSLQDHHQGLYTSSNYVQNSIQNRLSTAVT